MRLLRVAALVAVCVAPALAVPLHPAVHVRYGSPAGTLPVEHVRGGPFDAVLPSGRFVTPSGTSVVTGMNALGVALTPDGRYAIVSNDDERDANVRSTIDPDITGGYALAVVDVATMRVVSRFSEPGATYFAGVAAFADPANPARTLVLAAGGGSNAVYVFSLAADGTLNPDRTHVIPIGGPFDPLFANDGHRSPATIVVARDGRRAYVVDQGGDDVATIDVLARRIAGTPQPVGYFPFGAALAGDRLLVTNEGLMRYGYVEQTTMPPFGYPPPDRARASSLSVLDLDAAGDAQAVVMDNPPDGIHAAGGAHPSALAVTPDGAYAFVAMTGVDRIATVALAGTPRVVGGTELRLFDRGPYGTQPAALALSRDGSTLYVALAGLDAVAVIDARDPVHLHRKGLIPTGWFPSALVLAPDDAALYVVNTKGFGHDAGFSGDDANAAGASATWSTLEKIDLGATRLGDATLTTLKNARAIVGTRAPALPHAVRNVVVIEAPGATFDAVFGDLRSEWSDPEFATAAALTPNLHVLAQRYALALNFYADAEEADAGHQFLVSGEATAYTERAVLSKGLQRTLFGADDNPEDAARSGSIFDELARHRLAFRDYGDLLGVAGYDDGAALDPRADDPAFVSPDDLQAPTQGLGGRYAENVPVPAVLRGHVDVNYPARNARIRDERRAAEFVRDYGALARRGRAPQYAHVVLDGSQADADAAIGTIVAALSHGAAWRTTAVFITPSDALGGRDHIDEYRTYALVVSPWVRPGYLATRHLSSASVLKTAEELLGLHPLSLGDLLASDMSDAFGTRPNLAPYVAAAGLASRAEKATLSP